MTYFDYKKRKVLIPFTNVQGKRPSRNRPINRVLFEATALEMKARESNAVHSNIEPSTFLRRTFFDINNL